MAIEEKLEIIRNKSLGQEHGLNLIDSFGIYLSNKRITNEIAKLKKPINCLDIGCGFEAKLLLSLIPYIESGAGIDIYIAGHLKEVKKVRFIEGYFEDALKKLEDEKFNLILCISVIEHLYDPDIILQKIRTVLSRDGVLLINVPTWRGKFFLELLAFKSKLSKNAQIEMDDHKMYYDKRDLWPLLIKAGFKPSQIEMSYHKFGLNLFCKVQNQHY